MATAQPAIVKPVRKGKGWEWMVRDRVLTRLLTQATAAQRGRARAIIKEALRQYSPKLTGRLSKSWEVLANAQGRLIIRSKVEYSRYQNTEIARNRGYIQRALLAAKILLQRTLLQGDAPPIRGAASPAATARRGGTARPSIFEVTGVAGRRAQRFDTFNRRFRGTR